MFWRSVLILSFVLFVHLAFVCMQVAKTDFPYDQAHHATLLWNPFSDESATRIDQLEKASTESLRRLEFMTFSRERQREASKVVASLRQQINLAPYNAQRWGLLVDMEALAKQEASERTWAIEAALTMGQWNNKYRLAISSYCVEESLSLLKYNPNVCQRLLTTLPHETIQRNAHGMGLNYKYLELRLQEIEHAYGFSAMSGGGDEY